MRSRRESNRLMPLDGLSDLPVCGYQTIVITHFGSTFLGRFFYWVFVYFVRCFCLRHQAFVLVFVQFYSRFLVLSMGAKCLMFIHDNARANPQNC